MFTVVYMTFPMLDDCRIVKVESDRSDWLCVCALLTHLKWKCIWYLGQFMWVFLNLMFAKDESSLSTFKIWKIYMQVVEAEKSTDLKKTHKHKIRHICKRSWMLVPTWLAILNMCITIKLPTGLPHSPWQVFWCWAGFIWKERPNNVQLCK